jgi:hypothetical protein
MMLATLLLLASVTAVDEIFLSELLCGSIGVYTVASDVLLLGTRVHNVHVRCLPSCTHLYH